MKILAIETSCDETAISIVDFKSKYKFKVLSDIVLSQIDIHKEYGGVFPALAKREHIKNIYPLFLEVLKKSGLLKKKKKQKELIFEKKEKIKEIFNYDEINFKNLLDFFSEYEKPDIDIIGVTYGPGLEMSLWTGFNFARALSEIWDIEIIPVNHMEGHIFSSLIQKKENDENEFQIKKIEYPALSLLISGGHTELILIKSELEYELLGQTLDDAVGEAYDKTARLIGIDYPGGPEISKLAGKYKGGGKKFNIFLPRPMMRKNNFNFSFSGLKTAVLYLVREYQKNKNESIDNFIDDDFKIELAVEFENAVSDVILKKTQKAIENYKIKNLLIGGGVSANNRLRREFEELTKKINKLKVFLPDKKYTGDNALMIAIAAYYRYHNGDYLKNPEKVYGNLKLKKSCSNEY